MSALAALHHDTAAAALTTLRLRVGPLDAGYAQLWESMLGRLPAIASAQLQGIDGEGAHFRIDVPSISRLHVQLNHLAEKMDARFEPTEVGELWITLRPAAPITRPASDWSRTMASRARAWQTGAVALA